MFTIAKQDPNHEGRAVSDTQPTLDERIAALGKLAERLERSLPSPLPPPRPSPPASSDPLAAVRVVLSLFAVVAGWLLVQDGLAIFVVPDDRVFVALEGREFHVWRNVHAYEAATGKQWIAQPPGTTELVARYHNARRSSALAAAGAHLLLLVLSVAALRKLRQTRARSPASGGEPAKS